MTPPALSVPRLRLRGITKRYGPLVANDRVDLDVQQGGIHAIVGENGAGKTTLMRIISGLTPPDDGLYELDGRQVRMSSPAVAIGHGIGMVHQRFELVAELSALENLVLGRAPARHGIVFDHAAAVARARELATRLQTSIPWDQPVKHLTVGARQRLEIMRLLYRDAETLIFDEPTSILTPREADDLFQIMRVLAAQGKTIVFITHKLREVFAVADTVTVMRRGRVVSSDLTANTNAQTVSVRMVGELLEQPHLERTAPGDEPVLDINQLTVADDAGSIMVRAISFVVHASEILGIAGVEGNGQRELVQAIVGTRHTLEGSIRLAGAEIRREGVRARRRRGLAYISEDRDGEGACLSASLADNLMAIEYDRPPLSVAGQLRPGAIRTFALDILRRFSVRAPGPDTPARSLSGGNLQRLVVGRELHQIPRLLVAAHPTRGVDVRGIAFIHDQLRTVRAEGAGVLVISEELGELIELCDRLLVLFEGRIVADLPVRDATPERLGALMTGAAA